MSRSPSVRYARPLLDLAEEAGEVEEVGNQLEQVSRIFEEDLALRSFLQRPDQDQEGQLLLVSRLLDALEIQGLARRFLLFLLRKERFPLLPEICRRYGELADERLKRVRVTLSVPSPLQKDELESVRQALGEKIGKTVALRQEEDPSLLGGWVAEIGRSELWDASITGELAGIKRKLMRNEGSA